MVAYYKIKKTSATTKNKSVIKISVYKTTRNIRVVNVESHDKEINPVINTDKLIIDTNIGTYSLADTTCVNKHTYIESIIEGFTMDGITVDTSIGKLSNLPIYHTVYTHNNP